MDVEISKQEVLLMARPRTRKTQLGPRSKEDVALGARLKALRMERGLSQTDLAERSGIDQRIISCYELGYVRIPARELIKMAGILKASLKEFVGDNGASTNGSKSRKILKLVEKIESLPTREQKAVLLVLDGVISKYSPAAA